jgi:hypothetical protein
MAKKQLNISGKILSLILFVIVISLFGFGYCEQVFGSGLVIEAAGEWRIGENQ